jgi:hypothetical protein
LNIVLLVSFPLGSSFSLLKCVKFECLNLGGHSNLDLGFVVLYLRNLRNLWIVKDRLL